MRRLGRFVRDVGARQAQDGVELVDWASKLPNANGRVGMFGVSYLAINQLFTAAAVGTDSPLKAIFPVMAARDFYRDAAAMGGVPHLRTVRAYGAVYRLLNVVNPTLELFTRGGHTRPRSGGFAAVRQRGRDQRRLLSPSDRRRDGRRRDRLGRSVLGRACDRAWCVPRSPPTVWRSS